MSAHLDLSVMKYASYNDYLKSFIKEKDVIYLGNVKTVKRFAKLGYCSTSKVYNETEFDTIRSKVKTLLHPKLSYDAHYGSFFKGTDAALKALKDREEANLLHKLSTIIFIQVRKPNGFDISGYIDFEESLRNCSLHKPGRTNWKSIFEEKTRLRPKPTDLSYYDWHKSIVHHNDTENFHVVNHGKSLIFMHKNDHKMIPVTDKPSKYSRNVQRNMILSELYGYLILYDHVVR